MRNRVAAIEKDIAEFGEKVAPLAAAHDVFVNAGHSGTALAADTLIERLQEANRAHQRRESAIEQQQEAQRRLDSQQQRLARFQKELEDFLALGGTDDPEAFRLRAREHEERQELERRTQELRQRLEQRSGPGEQFAAYQERLAATNQAQLNEDRTVVGEHLSDVESRRSQCLEQRGHIDSELDRLTGEAESSQLRVQRETLLEQLREAAREWAKLALAQELLDRTRQKFEEERQPRVVQHAEEFFVKITNQRYNRLYVPVGQHDVTVRDRTGGDKQPNQLSRGTREQLYLALRFGLIREFGEHAERLPVVVDEVLVNFDPERSRQAAEAFAELSHTNQVLVFTCHPAMADLFSETANAQVINIGPEG